MRVLVTGASGFVGKRLMNELGCRGLEVRIARRLSSPVQELPGVGHVPIQGKGDSPLDWADAVAGCTHVIHLAARAHVLDERAEDPVMAFTAANVHWTQACAEAAARAGARRFIFASSVGVHGSVTTSKPFDTNSPLHPATHYARSKAQAERCLMEIGARTGLELVVVRPPLVYGPHAPGNFGVLQRVLANGLPLPLAAVTDNRRSFVAVDNLVDLLITCLSHPAAANQTFLVSDGEDLSTAALLRRLGQAMNRPARLFPVPPVWLRSGADLLGKGEMAQRLLDSLQVDISHTREALGWTPPISVDEGLRRAAAGPRTI